MNKDECIIIIGEGGIPSDFPKNELSEFLILKAKIESFLDLNEEERKRFEYLKNKLKGWRRNFRNDEYFHSLFDLSNFIQLKYRIKTFFAFLDFSEPDLMKSIEDAIKNNFKRIFVVSTKLINKKEEELKISDEIELMRKKYKGIEIVKLTIFDFDKISSFLMNIVKKMGGSLWLQKSSLF